MLTEAAGLLWLAAVTLVALTGLGIAVWQSDTVRASRRDATNALDAADEAVEAVNQVIDHLADTDPPGEGRHAHP